MRLEARVEGRYVRVCATHGTRLVGEHLLCPASGVCDGEKRFAVLDTKTGTVVASHDEADEVEVERDLRKYRHTEAMRILGL